LFSFRVARCNFRLKNGKKTFKEIQKLTSTEKYVNGNSKTEVNGKINKHRVMDWYNPKQT